MLDFDKANFEVLAKKRAKSGCGDRKKDVVKEIRECTAIIGHGILLGRAKTPYQVQLSENCIQNRTVLYNELITLVV